MLSLNKLWMPQKSEKFPLNWDDIDVECQHIPLNCPWTITSVNEILTVVITCLQWIFNYDFWTRVTAHPVGNPTISKQIAFRKPNPLLASQSDALDDYEDFSEPHFNSYQLHILGELLDSLSWRYNPHNGQSYLAYPCLAIDKFSGTDPDQDAEPFIQLIERKINFALGDAPGDAGELANYIFRKEALSSSLLRGPAAEWYESNITNATTWENVRTNLITRFSDGRNKIRYRMEVEHCIRGDGEEIRNFLHRIKRTVDKGWPDDMEGIAAADHGVERAAQGKKKTEIHWLLAKTITTWIPSTESTRISDGKPECYVDRLFYQDNTKRCIIPSLFQLSEWRRTNQGSDGHFEPSDEESTIGTTRTPS